VTATIAADAGPVAHSFKIVVAGSFAAGKSTLIREISDTGVVGTEAPTSGPESLVKETTTVGTEFGTLTVGEPDDAVELLLHGLPGQERFRFMWDIVAIGADGFVLLVDAERPETWPESAAMAAYLEEQITAPVVVGVNRARARPDLVAQVAAALGRSDLVLVPCDVTDRSSARELVVELLLLVLDRLDGAEELDDDPSPSPDPELP
jgi:signal recognition particle receptor subunit beta